MFKFYNPCNKLPLELEFVIIIYRIAINHGNGKMAEQLMVKNHDGRISLGNVTK